MTDPGVGSRAPLAASPVAVVSVPLPHATRLCDHRVKLDDNSVSRSRTRQGNTSDPLLGDYSHQVGDCCSRSCRTFLNENGREEGGSDVPNRGGLVCRCPHLVSGTTRSSSAPCLSHERFRALKSAHALVPKASGMSRTRRGTGVFRRCIELDGRDRGQA